MTKSSDMERFDVNPACVECPWILDLMEKIDDSILKEMQLHEAIQEAEASLNDTELEDPAYRQILQKMIDEAKEELAGLETLQEGLRKMIADKQCEGVAEGELVSPQGTRFLAITCANAFRQEVLRRIEEARGSAGIVKHAIDGIVDSYVIPMPGNAEIENWQPQTVHNIDN